MGKESDCVWETEPFWTPPPRFFWPGFVSWPQIQTWSDWWEERLFQDIFTRQFILHMIQFKPCFLCDGFVSVQFTISVLKNNKNLKK